MCLVLVEGVLCTPSNGSVAPLIQAFFAPESSSHAASWFLLRLVSNILVKVSMVACMHVKC